MENLDPKTKLSRGPLFGPTYLAITILLLAIASSLLTDWFLDGVTMNGVLGSLLMIAVYPFSACWQDYHNGECQLFFCDDTVLTIRERPWKLHYSFLADLKRIVRDDRGYTIVLKNGRRFRMLHIDIDSQHRAVIARWHARMESAGKTTTGSSDPTAA